MVDGWLFQRDLRPIYVNGEWLKDADENRRTAMRRGEGNKGNKGIEKERRRR
jgi:hypothetical protein